jgi:ADP-heptose:LPS heptosyltransferase
MFRSGHNHEPSEVNILFNDGGLGDNIARMPAVRYLKDNYPFLKINLFVPDYFFDLANNLLPGINVIRYSEGHKNWKGGIPQRQTKGIFTNFATHLTDHAFYVLCNKQVPDSEKNYLKLSLDDLDISRFNLPERYVVVTTGFTAPVREFLPRVINEIVYFLRGRNVTPVFLGSKDAVVGNGDKIVGNFNNEIAYERGIDLINQTSLLEAGKVIANAEAIVGLDNGLLHLAGCTEVPIVAGFTTVDPFHRLPYRHDQLGWNCFTVVPDESLNCRFCQSNWDFKFEHDYKFCYYKDYKCVKKNKAQDYITHLKAIVK